MNTFKKQKKINPRKPPENLSEAIANLTDSVESKLGPVAKAYSFAQVFKTFILFGGFMTAIFINWRSDAIQVNEPNYVAQVRLDGNMTDNAGGAGYNLAKAIQKADQNSKVSAIMIIANSGGGSPVQGEAAYSFIKNYTEKPLEDRKPLYVSIQGICASACYLAIAPADKIFAHKSSMIGSIGVRMDSWDFTELASKLGIKKRILTSVSKKVMSDPFKALQQEDEELLKEEIMTPMHENFVSSVVEARASKLTDRELFNGMVWLGDDAKQHGFIDEIASTIEVENMLMQATDTKNAKSIRAQGFSLSNLLGDIL